MTGLRQLIAGMVVSAAAAGCGFAPVSAQAPPPAALEHLVPAQDQPRQAQQPWMDRAPVVTSSYYRIKSDLPADELRHYAAHLDNTFVEYRRILGSMRQNLPATFDVMLFARRDDYQTTLRFNYGIDATGSGGMFFSSPRGSALAIWTEGLPRRRVEHVIQHEGFHQVAFALFGGNLPPWANEGLAEFFGEGVMVGRRLIIGQTNPRTIDRLKDAIENGQYIPFRQMLLMDGGSWNANVSNGSAQLQYNQAWSMVHFLVYGDGGKYAVPFSNYLRYLNAGVDSVNAFIRAFGTNDIEAFERAWAEFATKAKPSSFLTAMERIEFLAAGLHELARQRIYPATSEELEAKLKEINFTYTLKQHGMETVLKADDDAMFRIPPDDLSSEKPEEAPVFIVEETPLRTMPARERRLNADNPAPPTVKTEFLEPHNLRVKWIRDLETNTFTFEIVVE